MSSHKQWLSANAGYAGELARSAWSGAARGWDAHRVELSADPVPQQAVLPIASAAVGIAAGVLSGLATTPRHRTRNAVVGGIVGATLGLAGAAAWCFRESIGGAAQQAARQVEHTRNLRWLEENPIDYA